MSGYASSFARSRNDQIHLAAVDPILTVALFAAGLHLLPKLLDRIRRVVRSRMAHPREYLGHPFPVAGLDRLDDDVGMGKHYPPLPIDRPCVREHLAQLLLFAGNHVVG